MSGKKKKIRGNSGFITGATIVSIGLLAGFKGVELTTKDKFTQKPNSEMARHDNSRRTPRDIRAHVTALDKLVTASLAQSTMNDQEREDTKGLTALIKAAQQNDSFKLEEVSAVETYPTVNRAEKTDRAPIAIIKKEARKNPTPNRPDLFVYRNAKNTNQPSSKLPSKKKPVKRLDKNIGVAKSKAATPQKVERPVLTFADSADIALFAGDMPLPARLKVPPAALRGAPLVARSYPKGFSKSPLRPRKLASGKAFGGLAEREFQRRERRCMTTALYFEARSEPQAGQVAVGQVVMNRVKSPDYPDTICGVVYQGSQRRTGCQFSFTCDGKADKPTSKTQWERSKKLANRVLEGKAWLRSISNATHYHATYVNPRWRYKMSRLKKIGRHIFYKSPKISVTDTYQRYMSGKRS